MQDGMKSLQFHAVFLFFQGIPFLTTTTTTTSTDAPRTTHKTHESRPFLNEIGHGKAHR